MVDKLRAHPEKGWRLFLAFVIILNAALLWLSQNRFGMQTAAFVHLVVWPTLTWSLFLNGSWGRRLISAAALVMLLETLLALLLSYVPGELYFEMVLVITAVFSLLPLIFVPITKLPTLTLKTAWPYLLVFLVAVAFRLPNLSYSEFQGDESVIMMRAAAIITGDDAEIFLHQKGPVEILQPLLLWQISGEINEGWARVTFSLASVLSTFAVIILGWQWFGRSVGVLAGILLALTGFSVAFGRIVQYQSFVILWGAMALYHAVIYARHARRSDLLLSAIFLGGGLLAHYDAILTAPAIAWVLLWHSYRQKQFNWRDYLLAIGAGMVVLAVFYVPFFLNPNFGNTGSYLIQDRIGVSESTGIFSWSGTAVWRMITLYNSSYFIIGLDIFIIIGMVSLFKKKQGMAAILYFVVPVVFYLFIVVDPRTHVYTFFPGGVIVAAVGIVVVAEYLRYKEMWVYRVGVVLMGGWLVITAVYLHLMFIDNTPERMRTWHENKPSFYWTSWEEPPAYGLFGFPHQAGWRIAADLVSEDALPFSSNEEKEITQWYMNEIPRTHCNNFNTFVDAKNTQDSVPFDTERFNSLFLHHEVQISGQTSMWVYDYRVPEDVQIHDATHSQYWQTPDRAAAETFWGKHLLDITLGNENVKLLGYTVDTSKLDADNKISVTLFWLAITPFTENYQTFVHIYSDEFRDDEIYKNGLLAQHDSAPDCGFMPTVRWEPGQIVPDTHIINLPNDIEVKDYAIHAGMYNLLSGERLLVPNTLDNTIHLMEIESRN